MSKSKEKRDDNSGEYRNRDLEANELDAEEIEDLFLTISIHFFVKRIYETYPKLDRRFQLFQSAHSWDRNFTLLTGSRAEGLNAFCANIDSNCSDFDFMVILPSLHTVNTTNQEALFLVCEEKAPAYVTVRAGPGLANELDDCITTYCGKRYISAECIQEMSKEYVKNVLSAPPFSEYIHGPAYCVEYETESYDVLCAVACETPFEDMYAFVKRCRSKYWMNYVPFEHICKQRGILVPKPYVDCASDKRKIIFRKSFSLNEIVLFQHMPEWAKKAARVFKYVMKDVIAGCSLTEHPLSTYHTKTVTMWALEKMPDSEWEIESPARLLKKLLRMLLTYMDGESPSLPNYWVPECNLLDGLTEAHMQEVSEGVRNVQSRLVSAIRRIFVPPTMNIKSTIFDNSCGLDLKSRLRNTFAITEGFFIGFIMKLLSKHEWYPYDLKYFSELWIEHIENVKKLMNTTNSFKGSLNEVTSMIAVGLETFPTPEDIDCSSPAARVAWLLRPVTYCALTMADAGDRQAAAAFHLSAVVLHMSLHEERSHLSKLACWHLHETMNIMPRTEVMDGVCIMRNWKYSLSSWAEKLLSNLQGEAFRYGSYVDRLDTFGENANKEFLARCGFYQQSSTEPKMQCFSCDVKITSTGSIPARADHNPFCEHTNFLEAKEDSKTHEKNLAFPVYANKMARDETFLDWPEENYLLRNMILLSLFFFYPGRKVGEVLDIHKIRAYTYCCGEANVGLEGTDYIVYHTRQCPVENYPVIEVSPKTLGENLQCGYTGSALVRYMVRHKKL